MSNGFWTVLGAVGGAIVDAMEDRNRNNDGVIVVDAPRTTHRVERVVYRKCSEDNLRGHVYKTFGYCPDYYVVVKQYEDGTYDVRKLMCKHSTCISSFGRRRMTRHQLENEFIFDHIMTNNEFACVARQC